jgi:hypothetical protein
MQKLAAWLFLASIASAAEWTVDIADAACVWNNARSTAACDLVSFPGSDFPW